MRTPVELADFMNQVNFLEGRLSVQPSREPVPDDLQSEVRMIFNEALAGGPNMNGDAGPTLQINHALDCLSAVRRIAYLEQFEGICTTFKARVESGEVRSRRTFAEICQALENRP